MKKGWFWRVCHVGRVGQQFLANTAKRWLVCQVRQLCHVCQSFLADMDAVAFCDISFRGDAAGEFCRDGVCVAKLVFGDTKRKTLVAMELE